MCGRGGQDFSWQQVYEYLDIAGTPPAGGRRKYNIAPSTRRRGEVQWTRLPVARRGEAGRFMEGMVWPLLPPWMKGDLPKFSTANCRSEPEVPFSETVARKPAFRHAWKRDRRCLVPFSWFYEWDQRTRPKQPWRVMPVDAPMLVMAGLWDESVTPDGQARRSVTLVTTEPNRLLTEIGHNRAPVILEPEDWSIWLDKSPAKAETVIRPPAEGTLTADKVSRRVNNPDYDDDELRPSS